MRVKMYGVVMRAIEEGTAIGVRRAFKHTSTPDHAAICESVAREIGNALAEVIEWEVETGFTAPVLSFSS